MKYLFLILSFQLFGQIDYSELKNDLYTKNKVKEVRIYNMNFEYPNRCDSIPKEIKKYNVKGYLTSRICGNGAIKSKYKYEYNDENFLIDVDTSGLRGIVLNSEDELCDSSGITYLTFIETGFIGNCQLKFEEVNIYSINNQIQFKKKYQYDSFCRLIGTFYYSIENGKESFDGSSITEYNSFGLIAKEYQMNEKYEIYYVTDYEYDFY